LVVSKRERYIAIIAGAVIGFLVLDQVLITPLFSQREDLSDAIDKAQQKLAEDDQMLAMRTRLGGEWERITSGELKTDASTAQSQMLDSMRQWAQDSGLAVGSMRPERAGEKEKDFYKMTLRVTGAGTMAEVGNFIFRIQTASIPVRITDLSISSKEGTDELSLSLAITTIYLPPVTKSAQGGQS
jgi:Pilus assembly protein, PilO